MRPSPYYPQSNGKIERWQKSLKAECNRPGVPLNLQDARRLITGFLDHDNTVRLHSAIGSITPADKLAGKEVAISAARDQKLLHARETRKAKRQPKQQHPLISCHPNFFQLTLNQYQREVSSPLRPTDTSLGRSSLDRIRYCAGISLRYRDNHLLDDYSILSLSSHQLPNRPNRDNVGICYLDENISEGIVERDSTAL